MICKLGFFAAKAVYIFIMFSGRCCFLRPVTVTLTGSFLKSYLAQLCLRSKRKLLLNLEA